MIRLVIVGVVLLAAVVFVLVVGDIDTGPTTPVEPVEHVRTVPPSSTTTTTAPPPTTAAPTTVPRVVARSAPSKQAAVYTSHPCGPAYGLPPCYVMMRESGGDPNAYNPHGCGGRGCYGKWQCDPRTCSGRGTEEQQDAEARALWDGGRGCHHWNACAA